ncbi:MAG: amidase [Leptospiraceae bacterium]|nr:amidase [Leptospiraceae bacterium]
MRVFILVTFFGLVVNTIAQEKKDILFMSAIDVAKLIKEKKITSEEVVTRVNSQIEKYNANYNAIVTLNPNSIVEAKKADELLAQGRTLGPLHGVPIVIKDSFKVQGLRTTSGYIELKDYIPEEDAVVIKLLKDAGAIIIGKGNMPTLAMDMQTDNVVFGKTNNPWDTTRTSGGSTGGDAVSVASGFAYLGFGSDLAGSLRIPTSFTGTYGLKTTYGVVSKMGHIPPLATEVNGLHALAVMGPVARSIDDLRLVLEIVTEQHKDDKTMIPIRKDKEKINIKKLKIAWIDSLGDVPVQKEIKDSIVKFAQRLESSGAQVTRIEPKALNYIDVWETWGGIVGHQGSYDTSNFMRWIGDMFTRDVTKNIPMHRKIVGPISVPSYMELLNKQNKFITIMDNFLDEYDVWITPVSSTTAFKHHKPSKAFGNFNVYNDPILVDGKEVPYYVATQAYTTVFAVTENPVLSMPIAMDSNGLPIGVQVVAKRFQDFKLLDIGKVLNEYADKMNYPLQKK